MSLRNSVKYADLPHAITSFIAESTFTKAYNFPEQRKVIVWTSDKNLKKSQEQEFSLMLNRFLTRDEREKDFPRPEVITMMDEGLSVIKSYRLEYGSDRLYETYDVRSLDLKTRIATCEQIFYSPMLNDVGDLVRKAVKTASFSTTYNGWSVQERENYWVGTLYRIRRQTGESGRNEDESFSVKLLNEMKATDPNIVTLLPAILGRLAAMESVNVNDLIDSFNQKTSLFIKV